MKIVIFDFDCTLTMRHYYHFLRNQNLWKDMYRGYEYNSVTASVILGLGTIPEQSKEYIVDAIWGGHDRVENIRELLKYLKTMGYDLAVSSRGKKYEIATALNIIDCKKYFSVIQGSDGVLSQDGVSQYSRKTDFIKRYVFKNYDKVIYIDDDSDEHKEVTKFLVTYRQGIIFENNDQYEIIRNGDLEYVFIKSLDKNIGGGIGELETGLITMLAD